MNHGWTNRWLTEWINEEKKTNGQKKNYWRLFSRMVDKKYKEEENLFIEIDDLVWILTFVSYFFSFLFYESLMSNFCSFDIIIIIVVVVVFILVFSHFFFMSHFVFLFAFVIGPFG